MTIIETLQRFGAVLVVGSAFLSSALAQGVNPSLQNKALLGVGRSSGSLLRYDFASHSLTTVGTATGEGGTIFKDIQASAYVPEFQNLFSIWTDPSDGVSRLLYTDIETGRTSIIGQNLEFGRIKGATVLSLPDPDTGKIGTVRK